MMQLDRLTLGRMAKELGFVRDTLEKVCRLADVLKFMESDELLSEAIALRVELRSILLFSICQDYR